MFVLLDSLNHLTACPITCHRVTEIRRDLKSALLKKPWKSTVLKKQTIYSAMFIMQTNTSPRKVTCKFLSVKPITPFIYINQSIMHAYNNKNVHRTKLRECDKITFSKKKQQFLQEILCYVNTIQ